MSFLKRLFAGSPKPPESARTMSRNAPCWCGSEKKYKNCHYDSDRARFSSK